MSASSSPMWIHEEGVASAEVRYMVPNNVFTQLKAKPNPMKLKWEVDWRAGNKTQKNKHTITNLHMVRASRVDEYHVEIVLADERFLWDQMRLTGDFNGIRLDADASRLIQGVDPTDPLADYQTIANIVYRRPTLKRLGDQDFLFTFDGIDRLKNGILWDILDILEWLLSGVWARNRANAPPPIKFSLARLAQKLKRGTIVPQGLTFGPETLFPAALSTALGLARAGMWITPEGLWEVYSQEEAPFEGIELHIPEGSAPAEPQDRSRERPHAINVRFPRLQETVLTFDLGTQTVIGGAGGQTGLNFVPNINSLSNIMPTPSKVIDPLSGETFLPGQYIPIVVAMAVANNAGIWPGGLKIRFDELTLIDNTLALDFRTFEKGGIGRKDVRAGAWLAAIRRHYLVTYQIRQDLLEHMETWKPRRATGFDQETGRTVLSPVWQHYAEAPSGLIRYKNAPTDTPYTTNHLVETFVSLENQTASPFTIAIVNKALGVFRVVQSPGADGRIRKLYRTTLAKPLRTPYGDFQNHGGLLQYDEAHLFRTIISYVPRTPPDSRRYLTLQSTAAQNGFTTDKSLPRHVDKLFTKEYARHTFDLTETQTGTANPQSPIDLHLNNKLVNGPILARIAADIATQIYYSYADRIIGEFRAMGHDPKTMKMRGNMDRMTITYTPDGAFSTTFLCADYGTVPDLLELTSDEVKKTVFRYIGDPDTT